MYYAAFLILTTDGRTVWHGYRGTNEPITRARQLLARPNVRGVAIYDRKVTP